MYSDIWQVCTAKHITILPGAQGYEMWWTALSYTHSEILRKKVDNYVVEKSTKTKKNLIQIAWN